MQCQPCIRMGIQKGPLSSLFVSIWPAQTQAGSCLVSYGLWDQATYVLMAMPLALQPRHQLIHSLCTYGPWRCQHFHNLADQAQADFPPVYLHEPQQCQPSFARTCTRGPFYLFPWGHNPPPKVLDSWNPSGSQKQFKHVLRPSQHN